LQLDPVFPKPRGDAVVNGEVEVKKPLKGCEKQNACQWWLMAIMTGID
jgi:hypothetical protein